MVTLQERNLAYVAVVGAIGLILLGIGVGGLASLPSTVASSFGPMMGSQMMGPMMGQHMMGMMMGGGMFGVGSPGAMGMFASNPGYWIDIHAGIMTAIYFGLIVVGGYLIYRTVAPILKISTTTTAK